jgi:hypothetical protein
VRGQPLAHTALLSELINTYRIGLGGHEREDHNELCEEALATTQCSRRAFRELVYGHSYSSILGALREQVPGYKPKATKKEQREQQAMMSSTDLLEPRVTELNAVSAGASVKPAVEVKKVPLPVPLPQATVVEEVKAAEPPTKAGTITAIEMPPRKVEKQAVKVVTQVVKVEKQENQKKAKPVEAPTAPVASIHVPPPPTVLPPPQQAKIPVTSVPLPQHQARDLDRTRFTICGKSLLFAAFFFLIRQYIFRLSSYQGSLELASTAPVVIGSYLFLAVLLSRALVSHGKSCQLPLAIASHLDAYMESWEFLAVADTKQLCAALQQVLLLLDACIDGIKQPTGAGISKAVGVLDFLHTVHRNLVSEIGSTVLVMRIIDSLRLLRGALLQLRLWSHSEATLMPVADVLSAGLVVANFATMLTVQQIPSFLGEMIVIPSIVFIFAFVYLMLHDLNSPFGENSSTSVNIDVLLYLQLRLVKKINAIKAKEVALDEELAA